MSVAKAPQWRKLPLSLAELCIDTTLRCGQSFRWRQVGDEWHCSLYGRVVSLKQDASHLHYRATWPEAKKTSSSSSKKNLLPPSSSLMTPPASVRAQVEDDDAVSDDDSDGTGALLRNYFNLSLSLEDLYAQWSEADANFRKKAPKFTGVRILNQDAWETVVAFICSSNNNISRISQMVHKLCDHYGGEPIATVAGHVFRDFPGPAALAVPGVEARLRELGFGYRAKYIADTAKVVANDRPAGWLLSLRNPESPAWSWPPKEGEEAGIIKTEVVKKEEDEDKKVSADDEEAAPSYPAAHAALIELSGVGPKVADCACLMGLGWGESVPLDTHMLQIAARDYRLDKRTGKSNSMTKGAYDAVGDHFRKIWGPQAGWAQSVLFTANLRAFSDRLKDVGGSGKAMVAKKQEVEVEVDEKSAKLKVKVEVKEEEEEETVTPADAGLVPSPQRVSKTSKKRKAVVAAVKTEHGTDSVTTVQTEVEMSATRRSKRRRT